MSSSLIFNIANKGLRLETPEDVNKLFADTKVEELEELILTSNTFGIGASEALGGLLARMKRLKVKFLNQVALSKL